ncbi:MAG: PAS domain S-box protein [Deltaproteobacteria bacterium]|nr:PAS domain S-box protein [Deltaproteobacteria bacterium]
MANKPNKKDLEKMVMDLRQELAEHHMTEEALRQSEEKYRNILESMSEGYYEVNLAGNFTFVNDALAKMHGRSHEEMMGLNNRAYNSPETSKRIYKIFNEMYRDQGPPTRIIDYEIIRKDGAIILAEFSASLLKDESGKTIGFRGVVRDRTDQTKAEKALEESEKKYRTILETMEEGYYEVDLAGNRTFFNDALCRIYGYSHDEMMNMNYRTYAPPETLTLLRDVYQEVYRTGIPTKIFGHKVFRKDGSTIMIEASVALRRDPSGNPIGFSGIIMDKTEQKKAEEALRLSEEKYRLLVENAHDGIFIVQNGGIEFFNHRTETITVYPAAELAAMPFVKLIHPKDKESVAERQRKVLAGDDRQDTFSFRMINRKGENLWVELGSVRIDWEGQPATLNFLRDISSQKRMENQLLQAQKMEAVGTLAGGIAHDFNNLLMGIQGYTSLILLDIGSDHPHYSKLKNIEQQVQAGAELAKQMLGVAKGGKYEVKATNINTLIEGVLDLYGRTRKEITIHKFLLEEVWTVEVDRNQIEQVLLNLYVNAGHAMPAGGDLYVETKNIILDENYTRPIGLTPGKFVRISVTDTGVGMDEATQKRAFDPFFTTKGMGRGTGLGLASAYGIIKNHNGIINIYSEKGQGTTFNIYLPATEKTIAQEANIPEKVLSGEETVLFVDDQESITDIGQNLLEKLGYRVITAQSGSEAIDIYRREGSRIDLVILDMIMPEMGGGETFDRLKEINPQIKVLLSSGYSINGQAKDILDRGCKGFLQKPFTLADLSKKLRQFLDEKGD